MTRPSHIPFRNSTTAFVVITIRPIITSPVSCRRCNHRAKLKFVDIRNIDTLEGNVRFVTTFMTYSRYLTVYNSNLKF